jgi:glycerol-3-phosphate O-acyltransferase 3/4
MFSDPYWNSAEQNLLTYIIMLMTSWAVVCDIYYLEPTEIRENETSIEFASRVKADICRKGGLVDLDWDGRIKREVENVVSKQQDKERKTFAEALEIKRSLSLSESEDPQLLVGVPPARHTEDLPEVIEDEDSGLEMKGSAVEGNVSRSSISNSST